jgi:formate hydrogenlyase subunit 6/NADH:ubiquinone oxidoreductase subunit I
MFKILSKTAQTGLVTIDYPDAPARLAENYRGAPVFDLANWRDARPAAAVCPTGAISISESGSTRKVQVDYGLCIYCGQCAEADPNRAIRMTRQCELAVRDRHDLVIAANYQLGSDGSHREFIGTVPAESVPSAFVRCWAARSRSARSMRAPATGVNWRSPR